MARFRWAHDMFSISSENQCAVQRPQLLTLAALLALNPVGNVYAHHGAAAHFDPDDVVTLEGMITELQFVNPHAFVHVDVADDSGATQSWRCELSGATQLIRRGWTPETLAPGQTVEIVGERARREENSCAMLTIVFTDGKLIESGLGIEGAVIPEAVAYVAGTASRPKYLVNGQPNLSGAWVSRSGGGTGNVNDGPPVPSAAGLVASEEFDFRYDNPVIRCESGNIIADWSRQSHVNDIQQDDDQITLRYGYLDLARTIHLDASGHPENLVPTVEGHSIGRWEDDVLVVDTIGFLPRALNPRAEVMISGQTHILERFEYDEAERALLRHYTVTDPLYLEKPYSGVNVSDIAAQQYQPFQCVDLSGENNRRPDE